MATGNFTIGANRLLRLPAQFAPRPFRPECTAPIMSQTPPAAGKRRSRSAAELRPSDRLRTLLRQFSHDLRSPLNTILGFADLLSQPGSTGASGPRGQEYAGFIKASGERLLATFTPLLQLARLEVGDLELDLQPLGPVNLIRTILDRQAGPEPGWFVSDPEAELIADETSLRFILALILAPRQPPAASGIQILTRRRRVAIVVILGAVEPDPEGLEAILAERLCRAMGGRLSWRRTPGREACFIILPGAGCAEASSRLSGP